MDEPMNPAEAELQRERNIVAAVLTFIPGLGHIYKGHYVAGVLWMVFGAPLLLWVGILLSLATAGIGLVVPLGGWLALAFDAYHEEDRRKHHWFRVM
jgi:hypothetical protein